MSSRSRSKCWCIGKVIGISFIGVERKLVVHTLYSCIINWFRFSFLQIESGREREGERERESSSFKNIKMFILIPLPRKRSKQWSKKSEILGEKEYYSLFRLIKLFLSSKILLDPLLNLITVRGGIRERERERNIIIKPIFFNHKNE